MPPPPSYTKVTRDPINDGDPISDMYVFSPKMAFAHALAQLSMDGVEVNGRNCAHAHDCCGHWYPAKVRVLTESPESITLVQRWYQNI